ncbi:ras guanine nucleotide exchange factor domain-containing protein [Amylostereum chailletii]|nr:ras guanine nucleotide exchange factor domain-containing protein [Amylostereum chailletii]
MADDDANSPAADGAISPEGAKDLPVIPSLSPIDVPHSASALLHSSSTHLDPSSHLAPPSPRASASSLRKSFSVDSFIRHTRSGPMNGSRRQSRIPNLSTDDHPPAPQPVMAEVHTVSYQERDTRFPLSSRSRGASISTTTSSVPDDSDQDSAQELSRYGDGSQRRPVNGKRKLHHIIPPTQLPLPTKMPPLSSPSSASSLSSAHTHDESRVSPLPTVPHSRWSTRPGPSNTLNRSLSESLVLDSVKGLYQPDPWSDISIAVVGGKACGKSTAIAKGLKAYSLSEPTLHTRTGDGRPFTYVEREGRIPRPRSPDHILHVLEVDVAELDDPLHPGTFVWPSGAPQLDAVLVCYDVSRHDSVTHVDDLSRHFRDIKLPVVVFACKSDLERNVESRNVYSRIKQLDVGLVEVNALQENGKQQLRLGFDFLLRSIATRARLVEADDYNPASPDVLVSSPPPWEISRASTATPTAASQMAIGTSVRSSQPPFVSSRSPISPSPTRAKSTNDLQSSASEHEKSRARELNKDKHRNTFDFDGHILPPVTPVQQDGLPSVEEATEDRSENREKDGRPVPWATLEELLDKLLFLAVSGDDWTYISNFLLTYRRFASPRSVVLAMQKRMRQLDQPSTDPMFACFAQMRICHLLEVWIQDYPHDFAVGAAADALHALVKSIISKTHLLHYGSDFLPFLEGRPIVDKDAAWAMKVEEHTDESDDSYSPFDDDDDVRGSGLQPNALKKIPSPPPLVIKPRKSLLSSARERKSSLPLTARVLMMPSVSSTSHISPIEVVDLAPKSILKELLKISSELANHDPDDIAQEITRIETKLFFQIEPRHWLQHTLVTGRKEPETDSIARFSEVSNHLADWVVSLILCHDKPRNRARQIEKFVEIASKLRHYSNYSALRAFVAGINNATFSGDPAMEEFQKKSPGQYKTFQSWELLLQSVRSHRAYRMALRNTKGACIPALEVHLSDLIRAHEGNADVHGEDPSKIHWAKFNMMGKFIQATAQYQARCRSSPDYHFPERPAIRDLLMKECLMDPEVRIPAPSMFSLCSCRYRCNGLGLLNPQTTWMTWTTDHHYHVSIPASIRRTDHETVRSYDEFSTGSGVCITLTSIAYPWVRFVTLYSFYHLRV